MKSNLKNIAVSVSLAIGISSLSVSPANAVFVNTDYLQLGTKIYESMISFYKHAETMEIFSSVMDQASLITELKIDSENTAWSNVIVRQNNAYQAIQNLAVTEWAMAAVNPEIVGFGDLLDECNTDEKALESLKDDRSLITVAQQLDGVVGSTLQSKNAEIAARFSAQTNVCNVLQKEENESNEVKSAYEALSVEDNEQTTNANPVLASNLISTMSGDTLSQSQIQAVDDYIFLVAPPYVPNFSRQKISALNENAQIIIAEEQTFKDYPRMVLQSIGYKKHPSETHGLSELEILSWYAKEHIFSGDESLNNITGKIMNSELSTPSVVWKNLALLKSFQVHMALEKYKLSLTREATMAIELAYKIRSVNANKN